MSTAETQQPFDFEDFKTRFTRTLDSDPQNTVTTFVDAILQNPDQTLDFFAHAQRLIKYGTPGQSMPYERNCLAEIFPSQVIAELAKRIAVIGAKLGLDNEKICTLSAETAAQAANVMPS